MYPQYQKHKKGGRNLPPTPSDIEGPFYKEGAPERSCLLEADDERIEVSGLVIDRDGTPVTGATLDIWQADPSGKYDLEGYKYRGKVTTDAHGRYSFTTTRPGDYDISEPGAPQPHEFRCAHIHVKIRVPYSKHLTTQLYFPNDKYNSTDHWFDQRRVMEYHSTRTVCYWEFNFVLER